MWNYVKLCETMWNYVKLMKVDAGCFVSALGMIRHDLMVESESNNVSKDEKHCRGIGTAGGDLEGAFNGMLRRLGLGQVVQERWDGILSTQCMRHDTSVPLNTVRPYAHVFELIRLCGFVRFSKSVRLPALPRTFESLLAEPCQQSEGRWFNCHALSSTLK